MLMLTVSAIVWFGPAMEDRGVREGARLVAAYLNSARNRAIETGRPCGVIFHRDANSAGSSSVLDVCEVPPDYGGISTTSTATIRWLLVTPQVGNPIYKLQVTLDAVPTGMAKPGDTIRLNYQGTPYTISKTDLTTNPNINPVDAKGYLNTAIVTVDYDYANTQQLPWTTAYSSPMPYQISRSPINIPSRTAIASLELPAGVTIDLRGSGIGFGDSASFHMQTMTFTSGTSSGFCKGDTVQGADTDLKLGCVQNVNSDVTPVPLEIMVFGPTDFTQGGAIKDTTTGSTAKIAAVSASSESVLMFSATGALDSAVVDGQSIPVVDPVFLLVGKQERMLNSFVYPADSTNQAEWHNVQDLSNLWVVVGANTGLVTSDVVASSAAVNGTTNPLAAIRAARLLAAESQGMGGR
jgi:hypothetical protein